MYGYLRVDRKTASSSIRRYYRQQYCSLCHSLWNNYGFQSRFLLSYDVTFLAVLLNFEPQINFDEKLPICYFKKEIKTDKEKWKKLSAITVLLVAEKLNDNIIDNEKVKLSKTGMKLFSKSIKKARKDYNELYLYLKQSFADMNEIEKNGGDIYDMSDAFAKIMVGSKKMLFDTFDIEDVIISHISKWIYFIDAIDDLDKDFKEGTYNPFLQFANSREELIENHIDILKDFITKQSNELKKYLNKLDVKKENYLTIMNVLKYSIPRVTQNILLGKEPFEKNSISLRCVESKGGITFEQF